MSPKFTGLDYLREVSRRTDVDARCLRFLIHLIDRGNHPMSWEDVQDVLGVGRRQAKRLLDQYVASDILDYEVDRGQGITVTRPIFEDESGQICPDLASPKPESGQICPKVTNMSSSDVNQTTLESTSGVELKFTNINTYGNYGGEIHNYGENSSIFLSNQHLEASESPNGQICPDLGEPKPAIYNTRVYTIARDIASTLAKEPEKLTTEVTTEVPIARGTEQSRSKVKAKKRRAYDAKYYREELLPEAWAEACAGNFPDKHPAHVMLLAAYAIAMDAVHQQRVIFQGKDLSGKEGKLAKEMLEYFKLQQEGDGPGFRAALDYVKWYVNRESTSFEGKSGWSLSLLLTSSVYRNYELRGGSELKRNDGDGVVTNKDREAGKTIKFRRI